MVGRNHVAHVPLSYLRWRALHHHQSDRRLAWLWVRSVFLRRIFAPAVIHYTGNQEDQKQDNVAGDEDAKVQSDRVDLLVVLQKAHGTSEGPERPQSNKQLRVGATQMVSTANSEKEERDFPLSIPFSICLSTLLLRPPPLLSFPTFTCDSYLICGLW